NNGNWQWAASTGCDAQPYFRIFNPWRQQERFDPDCEYVKKWIPELADLPAKAIHKWALSPSGADYPSPIVDHRQVSHRAKMLFEMR
ncbi:MAG: FAD-binding domain-containing protein, partial [Verrucomicrobiia bacterium]